MSSLKRITAAAAATAVAASALAVPTGALAASKHWSSSQCKSYVSSFHKSHKHATSAQKRAADKALKAKGCSVKV